MPLAPGTGRLLSSRMQSEEERAALASLYERHFLRRAPSAPLRLVGPDGQEDAIPAELYSILRDVLQQLLDGQAITLVPEDTLLTSQQAAQLLNVSRPFLYKLIDQQEIDCFRVGTHRRLRLADVMALRQKRHESCGRALDALVELDEEESGDALQR